MNKEYIPKIIKGDFFKEYSQHLRPRTVDLFLADPPYGLFTQQTDLTGVADPQINLNKLEGALDYLLTKTGTILLFCDLNLLIRLKQQFNKLDFRWEYVLIKSNAGSPSHKTRPLNDLEYIAVFKREGVKASDTIFKPYESGRKAESYIKHNRNRNHTTRNITKKNIDINRSGKRYITQSIQVKAKCNLKEDEKNPHPFQKSEKLLRTLIKIHSNPGALVCDGFAGSSSSLIASYKEGRRSLGFEIDKKWIDVSRQRIKKETSQVEIFK